MEVSAGGVIVNNGDVVVVFQEKTQTWCLPKGHIEEGESIEETSRREITEETGITELTLVKKLGSYTRGTRKSPNISKQITILHFTTTQKDLNPLDDDNPEAKWIPIDKVANVLSYEEDKNFFLRIKEKLKKEGN